MKTLEKQIEIINKCTTLHTKLVSKPTNGNDRFYTLNSEHGFFISIELENKKTKIEILRLPNGLDYWLRPVCTFVITFETAINVNIENALELVKSAEEITKLLHQLEKSLESTLVACT